ncbi:MAG: hypothetical protein JWN25_2645 [Verrucomicrobiales bacterium]|nr:hypothetical protein [Verrucomicrobiales bacterium]
MMNTKIQSTKSLSHLHAHQSVHSTMDTTQKMSPSVRCDNRIPLGKCHFLVTVLVDFKTGHPSTSEDRPAEEWRSNLDPKSRVSKRKCPNPVLKMSFLKNLNGHKPNPKEHHRETFPRIHSRKSNLDLSPAVRGDNPVLLGNWHFLVTLLVTFQKRTRISVVVTLAS